VRKILITRNTVRGKILAVRLSREPDLKKCIRKIVGNLPKPYSTKKTWLYSSDAIVLFLNSDNNKTGFRSVKESMKNKIPWVSIRFPPDVTEDKEYKLSGGIFVNTVMQLVETAKEVINNRRLYIRLKLEMFEREDYGGIL